jgi:nitrite reductase/ring-hydroxylating ferredoxin subunit
MLKDVNPNIERVGFGGVLVVHALDDQFHAFDLACPYEVNQGVRVAADENNLFAICPKCGTKYDIAFGSGAPDGVSKYYLKRYTVTGSGTQLTVTN